jgi:hypothetical protein
MILEWIQNNQAVLWWLGALSITMFIGTLIAVPWLVTRIPDDYYLQDGRKKPPMFYDRKVLRIIYLIVKNAIGYIFIGAGIVMLVLPGQGVLTMLVGTILINFPGKQGFVRWLVSRHSVLRSVNWLRRRAGRRPLTVN